MIHKIETPTTTIIEGPRKANTSSGNWSVWLRDSRPDGSVVEYGKQFFRKRDAQQWIDASGLAINLGLIHESP